MKKISSVVLFLILGSLILSGCSNSSQPFEEKNYTSDTEIKEIRLDVRDREIEVSLSEDGKVHIKYYENSKEYYDISVTEENVLTMTSARDKEWTDYIGGKPSAQNRNKPGTYLFPYITIVGNGHSFLHAELAAFDITAVFDAQTIIVAVYAVIVYKR